MVSLWPLHLHRLMATTSMIWLPDRVEMCLTQEAPSVLTSRLAPRISSPSIRVHHCLYQRPHLGGVVAVGAFLIPQSTL